MEFTDPLQIMKNPKMVCYKGCYLSGNRFISSRVFHSQYKVGRNGSIGIKGFYNNKKKLPLVGLDLMQEIITGLRVQCLIN